MNPQVIFKVEIAVAAFSFFSLIAGVLAWRRSGRVLAISAAHESSDHQDVQALRKELEDFKRASESQQSRIARLERRIDPVTGVQETDLTAEPNPKPTITERRHRVLSLARRGQDAVSIAQTLGLPYGEVELMINLSRAA